MDFQGPDQRTQLSNTVSDFIGLVLLVYSDVIREIGSFLQIKFNIVTKEQTLQATLGLLLQSSLISLSILIFVCFCGQGGGFGTVSKKTSLCDMQHNLRLLYPFMKGLGGGPECFLCSLVHILNGLLLISLQFKGFYF